MRTTAAQITILLMLIASSVAVAAPHAAGNPGSELPEAPAIVGGGNAQPGQFPFMAALFIFGDPGAFQCGGSVIAPQWILTAAHCVSTVPTPDVVIGAMDRSGLGERIGVSRVVIHPDFAYVESGDSLANDLALLQLESPTTAPPIRLATGANGALSVGGQYTTALGLGHFNENDDDPGQLQMAELPLLDDDTCSAELSFFVREVMICAQAPGAAAICAGDSGSPVFGTTSDGDNVQVGITSWGLASEPCTLGAYSGLTEVEVYADFIAETIGFFPNAPEPTEPAAGPEVAISVSCLLGNGRVDFNLVNVHGAATIYRIEFEGLSARELAIAPLDWGRQSITGRQDGSYRVTVKRDGVIALDTEVSVDCDSDPTTTGDEVQVLNSCRGGNGYLLVQAVNSADTPKPYVLAFDDVPNRSTSAAPHGAAVRAITGRPDGEYTLSVLSNNELVSEHSVTVACDADLQLPVNCTRWYEPSQTQRLAQRSGTIANEGLSRWNLRRGPSTDQICNTSAISTSGDAVDVYASARGFGADQTEWLYIYNRTRDVWGWIPDVAVNADEPTSVDCSVWNEPTDDDRIPRLDRSIAGAVVSGWDLRHGPSGQTLCDTGADSFEGDRVHVYAFAAGSGGDSDDWYYVYNRTRDMWGWISDDAIAPASSGSD